MAFMRGSKDIAVIPAPNIPWLLLALTAFLIHYFMQAVGWHWTLRALGEDASFTTSVRMWYMSLIARWMPGRIWYSATRIYLAREANLSLQAVSFAMVFELLYIMVGGTLATLLFAGAQIKGLMSSVGSRNVVWLVVVILFAACSLILQPGTLLRLSKIALFQKLIKKLSGGNLSDENPPQMNAWKSLGLLLYYTTFWIYSGIMFGALASAFIPMNVERWITCIPAFAGSWLIGFFSIITPAGLGAREGAMWLMLRHSMPQNLAVVLAITSRLMMLATELLSVGIVSLLLRGRVRMPVLATEKGQ